MLPIITLAIVKIEQKSIVHMKINYNWMQDIRGAHFLPTKPSLGLCLLTGELDYSSYGK